MSDMSPVVQVCKSCGESGDGNFCAACGQSYKVKRITLGGLLHDVFHFFTHLEKGFGYTLKLLVTQPGTMQRKYIEGVRSKYQKPFSMFFICGSINALLRYWIYGALNNNAEAGFFHQYYVLVFILIMPLYILLTWGLFSRSKYNYAEIGVLMMYMLSFVFLVVTLISFTRFIWPEMDTAFIELPCVTAYILITNAFFFNHSKKWIVLVKSIILVALIFLIQRELERFVTELTRTH